MTERVSPLFSKVLQNKWVASALQGAANPIESNCRLSSCPRTQRWTRMERDLNCNHSGIEKKPSLYPEPQLP